MGLLGGIARTAVVAGTATAVSNRVSRRQANRWAEEDQAAAAPQYAEPQYSQPAPPPAAEPSMLDQLSQLGALRDQGVLTEDEFAAQKAKILGS
jgi:Short C-terminal domain